jgi:SAM-dependent methyltransferase
MSASNERDFSENRKEYWNHAYAMQKERKEQTRDWLASYADTLGAQSHILDMGCGTGLSTRHLISRGHSVVATDISDVALTRLRSNVPDVETKVLDFTLGLPWEEETFDHVIADLCLHYFDLDTTMRVVGDIARVLKRNGFLLARVNSIKDTAYGFGKGRLVQSNFFVSDGHYKRFFDRESINQVFQPFELRTVAEKSIETKRGAKHLYEIVGRRRD